MPAAEIYSSVAYQIGAFQALTRAAGGRMNHVKPHGALYNMAVRDQTLADVIANAIFALDPKLILFAPAASLLDAAATELGLTTASEVFADRNYLPDGSLVPRSDPRRLRARSRRSRRPHHSHSGRRQSARGGWHGHLCFRYHRLRARRQPAGRRLRASTARAPRTRGCGDRGARSAAMKMFEPRITRISRMENETQIGLMAHSARSHPCHPRNPRLESCESVTLIRERDRAAERSSRTASRPARRDHDRGRLDDRFRHLHHLGGIGPVDGRRRDGCCWPGPSPV